jgi:hypothetical protein
VSYTASSSALEQSRRGMIKGMVLGGVLVAPVVAMLMLGVPMAHLTRYTGVGVGLAIALAGLLVPRSGTGRIGRLLLGFIVGGLSWTLVPPLHGENLWDARHRADRLVGTLDALPVGDQAGFARSTEERARLMREYPELAGVLQQAETAWQLRSEQASASLRTRLGTARMEVRELIRQDRYHTAAALAERFVHENEKQAKEAGMLDELNNFRELCGYLADLARRAGKWDPMRAMK